MTVVEEFKRRVVCIALSDSFMGAKGGKDKAEYIKTVTVANYS